MSAKIIALVAVACAAGAAAFLMKDGSTGDDRQAARLDAQDSRIEQLNAKLDALAASMERVRAELAAPRVERVEASKPPAPKDDENSTAGAAPVAIAKEKGAKLDLDATLRKLRDPATTHEDEQELWQQIAAAGEVQEAIDALEEMAENDPANADLQVDLGYAYIQKLFTENNPMAKGTLAMQADGCYDRALQLDPEHWEARFSKAISYSFWPAITGKQAEAVKQFETLIGQQEKSNARKPEYASTYTLLGNLYKAQGKADLAKQTYEKGLVLFPDDGDLKAAMGGM